MNRRSSHDASVDERCATHWLFSLVREDDNSDRTGRGDDVGDSAGEKNRQSTAHAMSHSQIDICSLHSVDRWARLFALVPAGADRTSFGVFRRRRCAHWCWQRRSSLTLDSTFRTSVLFVDLVR